jgi:hypothetical protein
MSAVYAGANGAYLRNGITEEHIAICMSGSKIYFCSAINVMVSR